MANRTIAHTLWQRMDIFVPCHILDFFMSKMAPRTGQFIHPNKWDMAILPFFHSLCILQAASFIVQRQSVCWYSVETKRGGRKSSNANKSQQGPLRCIWSLGVLGEGSGWDLRIHPAPAAPGTWKSGDLGAWKSRNLEIWGPGNPEIWGLKNLKNENSQNSNPFCPKCRQGLD